MTRFIPMQISQSVMGNLHLLPVMTEFMQIQRQPFPEELLILQKVMRELKGSALILQAVKLMCQVRQMMETVRWITTEQEQSQEESLLLPVHPEWRRISEILLHREL